MATRGENFAWIIGHTRTVETCLSLAGAIKDRDYEKLKRVLSYYARQVEFSHLHGAEFAKARQLLALLLAPNLTGVDRVYDPQTGRSVFRFRALIQLIYWQIADGLNGDRLRQCRECQAYFFADRDNRKFCPPPAGVEESRCAVRHRVREFRGAGSKGRAKKKRA